MLLTVDVAQRHTWTVLSVAGDIDMASAPSLRHEVRAVLEGGTTRLVIDLADVDFCDSTGLGVLIGAVKRLRLRNGELRVVVGTDQLRDVIALTRLDRALDVYDDIETAVS